MMSESFITLVKRLGDPWSVRTVRTKTDAEFGIKPSFSDSEACLLSKTVQTQSVNVVNFTS